MTPPEGSRFGQVIATLIDKVYLDEGVDLIELRDALWRGAEEASVADHIRTEALTKVMQEIACSGTVGSAGVSMPPGAKDTKFHAWAHMGDFEHMDDWLNEYLVTVYLDKQGC